MADNLPTNQLPPLSRKHFVSAIQNAGFSMAQEQRLSTLPVSEIRTVLASQRKSLGESLTRHECDKVLRGLILVLPRAGLSVEDAHAMMDLYHGLLREAGMTFPLLKDAAQRLVMAPSNGKAKFFPDPGQLVEAVASEIKSRRKALSAIDEATTVLDNPAPSDGPSAEMGQRLHDLAETLKARQPVQAPAEQFATVTSIKTARGHTDAAELLATLQKKKAQG